MEFHLIDFGARHLRRILELNESEVPHVSSLSESALLALAKEALSFRVAETTEGQVAGFLLAFDEKAAYSSPNFIWFRDRYPSFVYVDRIAVAVGFRGHGVAKMLYEDVQQRFGAHAPVLACEVNVFPPNPISTEFHKKIGFLEVGKQDTDGGKKTVSMLLKQLKR